MEKSNLLPVGTLGASQEGTLVIEQFLMANYRFRRNILNGKVEFAVLPKADNKAEGNTVETFGSLSCASDEADMDYRPLTPAALSSGALPPTTIMVPDCNRSLASGRTHR